MEGIFPIREKLRRHTGLNPPFKGLHALGGPRPITWHRAVLHAFQDVRSMSVHVVERPKVKRFLHGLPVMLPEQRFDVSGEAQPGVVRMRVHSQQSTPLGRRTQGLVRPVSGGGRPRTTGHRHGWRALTKRCCPTGTHSAPDAARQCRAGSRRPLARRSVHEAGRRGRSGGRTPRPCA